MMDMRILFQDEAVLAVDKPAGLLSVPGRGPDKADCAIARALQLCPDALVVHRLDMGTSGILVFGRGLAAQRALSRAFEQRLARKRYEAVVAGQLDRADGQVELPLRCDWPNRPRQMVDPIQGKPALTRWQRLSVDPVADRSRVVLFPLTGRSHQLRVHLLALGHPIVGDNLYAPEPASPEGTRLMLHATRLDLPHPGDGSRVGFESAVPF